MVADPASDLGHIKADSTKQNTMNKIFGPHTDRQTDRNTDNQKDKATHAESEDALLR